MANSSNKVLPASALVKQPASKPLPGSEGDSQPASKPLPGNDDALARLRWEHGDGPDTDASSSPVESEGDNDQAFEELRWEHGDGPDTEASSSHVETDEDAGLEEVFVSGRSSSSRTSLSYSAY